jgi:hypothetical protein
MAIWTPRHTPGPWRLWLSQDDHGAFMLRGDSPESHGEDMLIVQRNIGTPNGDEGVANAHLIAAAPMMYEALLDALDVLPDADNRCASEVIATVRAAVLLAQGEPPQPDAVDPVVPERD